MIHAPLELNKWNNPLPPHLQLLLQENYEPQNYAKTSIIYLIQG